MKVHFYRDEHGYPRAKVPQPLEVLAWYLEQDVQGDLQWKQDVADVMDRIQRGEIDHWEATGNAHTLLLSKEMARIETEYADPLQSCELSQEDLLQAIRDWLDFVHESFSPRTGGRK